MDPASDVMSFRLRNTLTSSMPAVPSSAAQHTGASSNVSTITSAAAASSSLSRKRVRESNTANGDALLDESRTSDMSHSMNNSNSSLQSGLIQTALHRDANLMQRQNDPQISDFDLRDDDVDIDDDVVDDDDDDVDDFIHVDMHNQSDGADQFASHTSPRMSQSSTAMFVPYYFFDGSDFDNEYVAKLISFSASCSLRISV